MPTLTDADIAKAEAAPLTDSDIQAHESGMPQNWKDQLGDFGTHTWNMLKGVVTSPIQIATHPIDTAAALLHDTADEIGKGREAWSKGNYDQALEHFKYAAPVAGPILRQMREETDKGQYGAAAGDITGFVLGGKAMEAIPKVGAAAANLPSKAAELATRPGLKETMTGTAQVLGGTAGVFSGYPPAMAGGGAAILRGLENLSKGRSIAAAEAAPATEFLKRLNLSEAEYRALPADGKAQIQELVTRMAAPVRSTPPPAQDLGPIDLGPQHPPGPTPAQMVENDLAARRAAAAAPRPTTQRVPLWQQQQAAPAAAPPEAAPAPSMPVALPSGRVPGKPTLAGQDPGFIYDERGQPLMRRGTAPPGEAELPEAWKPQSEALIAKNPPPEAYESTYQARRARVLGEHLFDKGITVEQAMRIKPESLTDTEWETLLGKDPDTGEQYHAPSDVTLKQAVVNLQHLNRMARGNLIGATVTLKNGKTGIVKAMNPDGGFEYEELP